MDCTLFIQRCLNHFRRPCLHWRIITRKSHHYQSYFSFHWISIALNSTVDCFQTYVIISYVSISICSLWNVLWHEQQFLVSPNPTSKLYSVFCAFMEQLCFSSKQVKWTTWQYWYLNWPFQRDNKHIASLTKGTVVRIIYPFSYRLCRQVTQQHI